MKFFCFIYIFVITSVNQYISAQDLTYESWKKLSIQNIDIIDETEVYNTISNPAIGNIYEGIEIVLIAKNNFCISNFNTIGGIGNYSLKNGLSLNYIINYSGIKELYRLGNSIGISKRILKNTNIGIRINESKYYNQEFENKTIIAPEIGLHTYLTKSLAFAFCYRNIFSFTNSKNGYSISTGLKYSYSPMLTILIQGDKEATLPIVYKIGYKGNFNRYISLYLGVENSKTPMNILLNFSLKKSKYHIGCSYHEQLGISTNLGIERNF